MTEGRWLMAVEQLTSPDVIKEESVEEKVKEAFDQLWGVIVWNDPINLMSYVVYVFQRVLKMSKQDATRHMLEVHNKGKSMVAKETKEKAELLVHQLQGFGLQATMEKT
ncbi:ATP-dependent Clp protease adapter ClpS [Candidatus Methylacidiphilum fumarolicum]|jgi:ATP-dependent Clp protease adaptor protein ClpS|nr:MULTISPECIES: ATP-dependent Clp protease adapter ClpS [Methylacidiphilum (ex Ratnadevi et al. 2023)]MBW6414574.1 ATP-dependent Clp protease adapter ClpS [Candidatus Methylacidiphilum fumarolicum]TFE72643.1 ATP-dependent Clp protease adapter ClpS [Candidatus Methylacidiphilum fumarolicum]TFE75176.1 ATP-dependent Clp protease adapter ClpS [Candidatus Methylacidiphilum fumarolicum]